jgi:hypothetical protein
MVISSEPPKTLDETAEMFAQRILLSLSRALNDFEMCAEGAVPHSEIDIYRRKYYFRPEQTRIQQIQLYLRAWSPEAGSVLQVGWLPILKLRYPGNQGKTIQSTPEYPDHASNVYSITISDDRNRIGKIDEVYRHVVAQVRIKG